MKKNYVSPCVQVYEIDTHAVLTTSPGDNNINLLYGGEDDEFANVILY